MRLISAHVTNFRSAEDGGQFDVDQVTCLVGKNEAGKSAVLLALAALNPHAATPATFDKERDYPRRLLTQYAERHSKEDAIAISTIWKLDEKELARIADAVGPDVFTSDVITAIRRYGRDFEFPNLPLNFKKALDFLYAKFKLDDAERAVLSAVTTTSDLIAEIPKISSPTDKHKELQKYLAERGTAKGQTEKILQGMLPKFMYFSSYDRMDGAIQIELTRQMISDGSIMLDQNRGVRLFTDFLDYAGVSIDEISNETTYETFNAKLGAASNNITDQVLEYWTQNPDLSVEVRVDPARPGDPSPFNSGTIARARIQNSLHRVDTPFSERSAGFVWFFSFLVKFARVKNDPSPVVLLLDEPGLTLHGKAQADLLRFFREKLASHHQIIYSTHSPFMVPANELAAVRVVQDQIEMKGARRVPIGTKVKDDVLSLDPDTLFPLQAALGYDISQSLFVGKNTLLVEGPGDILYMQALSEVLRQRGRISLDARWVVCPAGGIDKVRSFVSLFAGNGLNVAVLSDQASGDRKKIEEMKRSAVLKAGQFYTMADFLERPEADIEDIFEPEVFANILNACYDLKDSQTLTADKLRDADKETSRLIKQAEAAFRVFPETIPMLDHFSPAAYLIRHQKLLDGKSAPINKTLDRAESIFSTFNKLLQSL
ncbi:MAG: hypothetical protein EOS41_22855 [Mesorhizobium sp.]|uniref:AAA family ATPase n=1 Tax=Mesorhizobium sp. TaxID=1871066 RepID=UPI000FE45D18|nr:AAA family ATPase [Mesorhizobium sp.]RWE22990.1 MAG: hypothetical protein EOS41_22855 [Mesorhizobium sp.]